MAKPQNSLMNGNRSKFSQPFKTFFLKELPNRQIKNMGFIIITDELPCQI